MTRTAPSSWTLALAVTLGACALAGEPPPKVKPAPSIAPAPKTQESSAEKKLTIVFTGDNGGEVAPCG